MKTPLFILLVGYMVFGRPQKTKNKNASGDIQSKEHGLREKFCCEKKADRALLLEADGKVIKPIAKN